MKTIERAGFTITPRLEADYCGVMILPPPWAPCRHPTWQWRAPCKPVKGRRAWVYVGYAPTDEGEPALWYSESATGLVRSHNTAEQAMATVAPDIRKD